MSSSTRNSLVHVSGGAFDEENVAIQPLLTLSVQGTERSASLALPKGEHLDATEQYTKVQNRDALEGPEGLLQQPKLLTSNQQNADNHPEGDDKECKCDEQPTNDDIVEMGEDGEEKPLLVEEFDENFVDRRAEPLADDDESGTLCEVCYSVYNKEDFFSLKCAHSFCVNCQADHLRTKITNGLAMKLPCMQQNCKEQYSMEQIQQFCSSKIQKTYNVIHEDVRVGKSNKLKWCARPDCENTIRRPGCPCKRRAVCECGFETCWKCGDAMHEAACQVSGEAGLLMHNINPRVSKCPNCKVQIYKIEGCNHMTCYRCNKDWCWICRRVTDDPYGHFSPGAIFGCAGMQEIPQSIILWCLLLTIQLFATPFLVVGNISYQIGQYLEHGYGDSESLAVKTIWFTIFGLPLVLIPTAVVLPVVILWRAYVIVAVLVRHFLLCCCC